MIVFRLIARKQKVFPDVSGTDMSGIKEGSSTELRARAESGLATFTASTT